jgi:hypothetical protein
VVGLALTMIETCVKNCVSVPQNINRSFMDEMVNVSTGRKGFDNQEEALRIIQMWGISYARRRNEMPIFYDTYTALKTKGVRFPQAEEPTSPESDTDQISRFGCKLFIIYSRCVIFLPLHFCNVGLLTWAGL